MSLEKGKEGEDSLPFPIKTESTLHLHPRLERRDPSIETHNPLPSLLKSQTACVFNQHPEFTS